MTTISLSTELTKKIKLINIGNGSRTASGYLYSRNICEIDNKHISEFDAYNNFKGMKGVTRKFQQEVDSYLNGMFLKNQLKGIEFDILHYTQSSIPRINTTATEVVTVHDNPNTILQSDFIYGTSVGDIIRKKYWKRLFDKYKYIENVLTNSNYVRTSLLEYGFTGNVETIYHPVGPYFKRLTDKNKIRVELGLPIDKILLLSVSTYGKRKNLTLIEKAMKNLSDKFILVRVGTQLGSSITFHNVSNEQINMIYNACDLLLIPSLEEGLGAPLIEGLASGLPVVASNIEVFHETGGDAIEYINPLEVQSLVNGIYNAIEYGDEMIKKGEKIATKFSFDTFRKKMLKYYTHLP